MLSNYFTLSALAREWAMLLPGSVIRDAYSPLKDELTISLFAGDTEQAIRISVRPGFHFIYRADRAGRPRANVTTLFQDAIGSKVESIAIHPSDRVLTIALDHHRRIDIHLYGSRANVFLIGELDGSEEILESFKQSDRYKGAAPPSPKTLPDADLQESLTIGDGGLALEKRLARLCPRFGRTLIREVIFRSGLEPGIEEPLVDSAATRVGIVVQTVTEELATPSPRVYRSEGGDVMSLAMLRHLEAEADETYASVDEAVRSVVRTRTRVARLESAQMPLVKALERTMERARRKLSDLEKASATESRADEYERWGHLLMANPRAEVVGDKLAVKDILRDGKDVEIPVKPGQTVIENAERYYTKARNLRSERATLEDRVAEAQDDLRTLMRLLAEAAAAEDAGEIERFQKSNTDALRRFIGGRAEGAPALVPFRRFKVSGGFEVWVGRNARENDLLTFDHASPHDLWFHARGVAGSHVVLRVPGRKTVVGKPIRAEAAAIAGWFSAARGSKLVPVIVTERKYVSKPKGSDPGSVRVHREDVLMVEPRLPF
ncbi:MAG TPA: NFACT RNA binding domain-containing protein [Rhodothermales bacterium]|nr:NFACT RNA binding domain-containing protein [Rhodothermales bacterium]